MKVALGIGCDRNTAFETLCEALDLALKQSGVAEQEIVGLATIDQKRDEPAILRLAKEKNWPLYFYRAQELAQVEVPNPSATVQKYMGCPAVAEAAALLLAGQTLSALILEKLKHRGADLKNVTLSMASF
ncbi:MAG: cobalamin biosynthesis protein CbiG [Candidatus Lambdaproteobacteria bacterium RIFOXYD2_FULL_50_16]|uniref:Cobalamin biosynthesis protein CbiG n=1 Tax=Candidatus Lambdaproteobacteria bacterium RIFOXYD2_FULL_50_16 TaxID=1817772 RepID=A0A1F6G8S5_9PROT|nr:MAG: cobalamin biosynthesis protein CbiG [Candidatus Lambdaproteobacteria bacterium RIFOXYD2_FULL_50_16]